MKNTFTLRRLCLCVAAVSGMTFVPIPTTANSEHPVYKISFGARGESTTVDNVLVENLNKGCSVQLHGQDTLLLKAKGDLTAIGDVQERHGGEMTIDGGRLSINLQHPCDVQVSVYGIDGALAWQTRIAASTHTTAMSLPPLGKGVYVVRATAPGYSKSVKWVCGNNAISPAYTFAATQDAVAEDTMQAHLTTPLQPMFALDSKPISVELEYAKGDVLRFTGTSGEMTTITTNSPRSSHPIYFDFFKCQDANGHNYAIVRAGDLMWMAEDLHKVNSKEITDAGILSQDVLTSVVGDPNVALVADDAGNAYYSKAAAIKAMPEGWSLPTQGELDYAIKKLNGGDYATAGALLKEPTSGVDHTSLRLGISGRYNGYVCDTDSGYLLTRSTKNTKVLAMRLRGDNDEVAFSQSQSYLLPVRGVRSAPSAYTEMMEYFGHASKRNTAARKVQLESGPLGKTYVMHYGGQSIAYDYTGGQLNQAETEARSGIIYKNVGDMLWTYHERRDANFLSDCGQTDRFKLRKMAAMTNSNGTQYTVEMQWSRPFRFYLFYSNTYPSFYSTNDSEDGVYITIAGDSASNYAVMNKPADATHYGFFIPLNASITSRALFATDLGSSDPSPVRGSEATMDFLQRHFQLLTADFNQDGVDDIVIGIYGELWVYDGATMLNAIKQGKVNDGRYTEAPLYHNNFNYEPGTETPLAVRMDQWNQAPTRFAVGDATGDGIPDITVLQVGVRNMENPALTGQTFATLMIYESGNVEKEPVASRNLVDGWTEYYFNDIKVGNVSGSKRNDIIVLMRRWDTKNDGTGWTRHEIKKKGQLWRIMYDPEEKDGHLYVETMDTYFVHSFRGHDGHLGNNNITLAHFRGMQYPCDVVVGADLWHWNIDTERLEFKFQILPFTDNNNWSIFADNIIAADPEGTGRDFLYYFRNWSAAKGDNKYMLLGFSETYFINRSGDVDESTLCHNHNYNSDVFKYCEHGDIWNNDETKQNELMWWADDNSKQEFANSAALCAVYARPGVKTFKFKEYQATFSEPRIHALIAAPPTYDYSDEPNADPGYDCATSWGYSNSQSAETTKSSSISASTIVGFEFEINAPITGTKLGGTDFTVAMQNEYGKSVSETQTTTYSQQYAASSDDRVVMQTTPYDNYVYVVISSSNPDEIGGQLNLAFPHKTMTVGLGLSDYDYYMADAPNAPDLHEVFAHEVGNPFSYPNSADQIHTNVANSEILWGSGQWDDFVTIGSGGSTTREIALDNSTATSASFSFSVETELVVTAGCAKAGCGFGYNNSNETTHEEGKGFSVSACVPGLATGDRNPNRRLFDWNLCWYKYRLNGQTFPVVNYIVRQRKL